MGKLKILLADDSRAIRLALQGLLLPESDHWTVCGEATDGRAAIEKVAELGPDVILLDLSLPIISGLNVAQTLNRDYPQIRVILMSAQDPLTMSVLAKGCRRFLCDTEISPRGAACTHAVIAACRVRESEPSQRHTRQSLE
jgi:two-component system response regulator YesN